MKIKSREIRDIIKEEIFKQILIEKDSEYEDIEVEDILAAPAHYEESVTALPYEIEEMVRDALSLLPSSEYLGAQADIKIDKTLDEPVDVQVSVGGKFPTEDASIDFIIDLERSLNSPGVVEKITMLPDTRYTVYFGSSVPSDDEIITMISL